MQGVVIYVIPPLSYCSIIISIDYVNTTTIMQQKGFSDMVFQTRFSSVLLVYITAQSK